MAVEPFSPLDIMRRYRDGETHIYSTEKETYDIWLKPIKYFNSDYGGFYNFDIKHFTKSIKDPSVLGIFEDIMKVAIYNWQYTPSDPCRIKLDDEIYGVIAELVETQE